MFLTLILSYRYKNLQWQVMRICQKECTYEQNEKTKWQPIENASDHAQGAKSIILQPKKTSPREN